MSQAQSHPAAMPPPASDGGSEAVSVLTDVTGSQSNQNLKDKVAKELSHNIVDDKFAALAQTGSTSAPATTAHVIPDAQSNSDHLSVISLGSEVPVECALSMQFSLECTQAAFTQGIQAESEQKQRPSISGSEVSVKSSSSSGEAQAKAAEAAVAAAVNAADRSEKRPSVVSVSLHESLVESRNNAPAANGPWKNPAANKLAATTEAMSGANKPSAGKVLDSSESQVSVLSLDSKSGSRAFALAGDALHEADALATAPESGAVVEDCPLDEHNVSVMSSDSAEPTALIVHGVTSGVVDEALDLARARASESMVMISAPESKRTDTAMSGDVSVYSYASGSTSGANNVVAEQLVSELPIETVLESSGKQISVHSAGLGDQQSLDIADGVVKGAISTAVSSSGKRAGEDKISVHSESNLSVASCSSSAANAQALTAAEIAGDFSFEKILPDDSQSVLSGADSEAIAAGLVSKELVNALEVEGPDRTTLNPLPAPPAKTSSAPPWAPSTSATQPQQLKDNSSDLVSVCSGEQAVESAAERLAKSTELSAPQPEQLKDNSSDVVSVCSGAQAVEYAAEKLAKATELPLPQPQQVKEKSSDLVSVCSGEQAGECAAEELAKSLVAKADASSKSPLVADGSEAESDLLELHFDADHDKTDHEAFKAELFARLRALGVTDETINSIRVDLKQGTITVQIRGPSPHVQQIREKPLESITVHGHAAHMTHEGAVASRASSSQAAAPTATEQVSKTHLERPGSSLSEGFVSVISEGGSGQVEKYDAMDHIETVAKNLVNPSTSLEKVSETREAMAAPTTLQAPPIGEEASARINQPSPTDSNMHETMSHSDSDRVSFVHAMFDKELKRPYDDPAAPSEVQRASPEGQRPEPPQSSEGFYSVVSEGTKQHANDNTDALAGLVRDIVMPAESPDDQLDAVIKAANAEAAAAPLGQGDVRPTSAASAASVGIRPGSAASMPSIMSYSDAAMSIASRSCTPQTDHKAVTNHLVSNFVADSLAPLANTTQDSLSAPAPISEMQSGYSSSAAPAATDELISWQTNTSLAANDPTSPAQIAEKESQSASLPVPQSSMQRDPSAISLVTASMASDEEVVADQLSVEVAKKIESNVQPKEHIPEAVQATQITPPPILGSSEGGVSVVSGLSTEPTTTEAAKAAAAMTLQALEPSVQMDVPTAQSSKVALPTEQPNTSSFPRDEGIPASSSAQEAAKEVGPPPRSASTEIPNRPLSCFSADSVVSWPGIEDGAPQTESPSKMVLLELQESGKVEVVDKPIKAVVALPEESSGIVSPPSMSSTLAGEMASGVVYQAVESSMIGAASTSVPDVGASAAGQGSTNISVSSVKTPAQSKGIDKLPVKDVADSCNLSVASFASSGAEKASTEAVYAELSAECMGRISPVLLESAGQATGKLQGSELDVEVASQSLSHVSQNTSDGAARDAAAFDVAAATVATVVQEKSKQDDKRMPGPNQPKPSQPRPQSAQEKGRRPQSAQSVQSIKEEDVSVYSGEDLIPEHQVGKGVVENVCQGMMGQIDETSGQRKGSESLIVTVSSVSGESARCLDVVAENLTPNLVDAAIAQTGNSDAKTSATAVKEQQPAAAPTYNADKGTAQPDTIDVPPSTGKEAQPQSKLDKEPEKTPQAVASSIRALDANEESITIVSDSSSLSKGAGTQQFVEQVIDGALQQTPSATSSAQASSKTPQQPIDVKLDLGAGSSASGVTSQHSSVGSKNTAHAAAAFTPQLVKATEDGSSEANSVITASSIAVSGCQVDPPRISEMADSDIRSEEGEAVCAVAEELLKSVIPETREETSKPVEKTELQTVMKPDPETERPAPAATVRPGSGVSSGTLLTDDSSRAGVIDGVSQNIVQGAISAVGKEQGSSSGSKRELDPSMMSQDVPLEKKMLQKDSQEPDAEVDPQARAAVQEERGGTPVFSTSHYSITPSEQVEDIVANTLTGEVLAECVVAEAKRPAVAEVVEGSVVYTQTPASSGSAVAEDISRGVALAAAEAVTDQAPPAQKVLAEGSDVYTQTPASMGSAIAAEDISRGVALAAAEALTDQAEAKKPADQAPPAQEVLAKSVVAEAKAPAVQAPPAQKQGSQAPASAQTVVDKTPPAKKDEDAKLISEARKRISQASEVQQDVLPTAEPEPESKSIDFLRTVIRTGAATPATLRDLATKGQPFRGTHFTDNDVVEAIRKSSSFWIEIGGSRRDSDGPLPKRAQASITTQSVIDSVNSARKTQATSKPKDADKKAQGVPPLSTKGLTVSGADLAPAAAVDSSSKHQLTEVTEVGEVSELLQVLQSRSEEVVIPQLFRLAYGGNRNDLRWEMGQLHRVEPTINGLPDEVQHREFTVSPSLPTGLHLERDTGVITGVPQQVLVTSFFEVLCRCKFTSPQDATRFQAVAHITLTISPQTDSSVSQEVKPRMKFEETRVDIPTDGEMLSVEDSRKAFAAIRKEDMKPLIDMVRSGVLKQYHLRSGKIVDDKGCTLMECASQVSNRRALNFFRNGLVAGPSFTSPNPKPTTYLPPYLTPMFPEAPSTLRNSPAHGVNPRIKRLVEAKAPAVPHTLTYPTFPKVLMQGGHCSFEPQHGTLNRQGACRQLHDTYQEYFICPPLPPELSLHRDTGCIYGTPSREMDEQNYEVTGFLGEGRQEVKCTISFAIIAAPKGLSYPSCERVFELPKDVVSPPAVSSGGSMLPQLRQASKTTSQSQGSPKMKRSRHPKSEDHSKPALHLKPHLMEGWADSFEIWPKLPVGMKLDGKTGAIQGCPMFGNAHPVPHHQSFIVYAKNPAGACACSVHVEACGGAWDLMCIKFYTESTRAAQAENLATPESMYRSSPTQSSPTGYGGGGCVNHHGTRPSIEKRNTVSPNWLWAPSASAHGHGQARITDRGQVQDGTLRDLDTVDWAQIVEKAAVILKDSGEAMRIKDVNAAVKGMDAKALLKCLGLEVDELTIGLLMRFIEQRGRLINKVHLPAGQAQIRADWRGHKDSPLVYLYCEGARLDSFSEILMKEEDNFSDDEDGAGRQSTRLSLSRQDHRTRNTQGSLIYKHQMPHEMLAKQHEDDQEEEQASKQEIDTSFNNLLPEWRTKLEEKKGFSQRRSAIQERWKVVDDLFS